MTHFNYLELIFLNFNLLAHARRCPYQNALQL
jgi:hypothetical protein